MKADNTAEEKADQLSREPKFQEFQHPGNSNDEPSERSDMEFSVPSAVEAAASEELVRQIHDQRTKLCSRALVSGSSASMQRATRLEPATNQLSPTSKKIRISSDPDAMPGAFAVDLSRSRNISASSQTDRDETSVSNSYYSESMMEADGATEMVQLEAVPVDESLEQVKLKEMEEQMNREKERRLSLERRMAEADSTTKQKNKSSCTKKRLPIIIMASFIVLSAIAVGVYFEVAPNETQDVASSSAAFFVYPPPTEKECEAVENGLAIPNQDSYPSLAMAMTCDISYNFEKAETIDMLLLDISEAYENIVFPAWVGCYDEDGYFNSTSFTEDRYLVANLQLASVKQSSLDCSAAEPSPCIRVTVNLLVWTETAEATFIDIYQLVQTNLPKLLGGLKESGVVDQYTLVSLGPSQQDDNGAQP